MHNVYRDGLVIAFASTLASLGCADVAELDLAQPEVSSSSQGLQTEYLIKGYAREVKGADILGAAATVITPLRDASGNVRTTSAGIPLQASCGATLIGPSYVITAAHCVDKQSVRNPAAHRVTLQTYSFPDGHDYRKEALLSGSYPNLTHGRDPEYLRYTERFSCQVLMRCSADFGNLNCSGQDLADTALLRCDGEPGVKYGYIPVAGSDNELAEPHMFWAHELYNTVNSEDFRTHYKKYPPYTAYDASYQENFHYWGRAFPASGNAGQDFNQAYPLRSTEFSGDAGRLAADAVFGGRIAIVTGLARANLSVPADDRELYPACVRSSRVRIGNPRARCQLVADSPARERPHRAPPEQNHSATERDALNEPRVRSAYHVQFKASATESRQWLRGRWGTSQR